MGTGGLPSDAAELDWFGTPLSPLAGGYSGETFLVGDGADRVVARIYRRNPDRAAIDASLLRLVQGIIPVPEVLELRPATADTPAVLVTEFLDGVLLEGILRDPAVDLDWVTLGRNLGEVLGALSGMPFLTAGMFDGPDLRTTTEDMPTDLVAWAQHLRDTGRLAAWSDSDWQGLLALIDLAEDLLASGEQPPRVVLAHSDFNPKNILIDPVDLRVVGLLDWEFSHAGSIYTDFGNITRFERDDQFVRPMTETFVETAPGEIRRPFEHGRAMDLWALIELAGGTPSNAVRDLASELLLAQARSSDLLAWPWETPRVDP
jgi:aminoglycoside phosphotransferase (APT) family kinase protein